MTLQQGAPLGVEPFVRAGVVNDSRFAGGQPQSVWGEARFNQIHRVQVLLKRLGQARAAREARWVSGIARYADRAEQIALLTFDGPADCAEHARQRLPGEDHFEDQLLSRQVLCFTVIGHSPFLPTIAGRHCLSGLRKCSGGPIIRK
jgi:hypothetical protein